MRRALSAVHRFEQIFAGIIEVHLPVSVWLDFATLELFNRRT